MLLPLPEVKQTAAAGDENHFNEREREMASCARTALVSSGITQPFFNISFIRV